MHRPEFLSQDVTPSPDVLSQELDGETVLLDLNSETYFGLNEVGTRVWQLIPEAVGLEGIFQALLAEYEVDEATLLEDLRELINDFSDAGLITVHPDTARGHAD